MLTKNTTLAGLGLAFLSTTAGAQTLVISEIVDGTLPGGLPKFVELTNHSAVTVDLSGFTIGNFNNGGTTLGGGSSLALSGMLPAGESYVISYESGDSPGVGTFFDTYGCDPDNFDLSAFINGDDAVALFLADGSGPNGEATGDGSDATLFDVYGEIGVDGTGTAWETLDSYGFRNTTTASATFNAADWTFAGPDALEDPPMFDDAVELQNLLNNTTPMPQSGPCNGPPVGFTSLCNGDGGDQMGCTDCPCANNAPMGTIGGCMNSSGGSTAIDITGSASVSLPQDISETSDLRITLSGAPANAFCVMLSGDAVAPQNMANPCFGLNSGAPAVDRDGLRCAVQGTLRHGGRSANASGEVMASTGPDRVWGGEAQPAAGLAGQAGFVSGQTRYFQVTHREDAMAVCMRGLNTSQAVEVTFTP